LSGGREFLAKRQGEKGLSFGMGSSLKCLTDDRADQGVIPCILVERKAGDSVRKGKLIETESETYRKISKRDSSFLPQQKGTFEAVLREEGGIICGWRRRKERYRSFCREK